MAQIAVLSIASGESIELPVVEILTLFSEFISDSILFKLSTGKEKEKKKRLLEKVLRIKKMACIFTEKKCGLASTSKGMIV